jgi:hypothetical protein
MKFKLTTLQIITQLRLNSNFVFGQDTLVNKHYEIQYGTNPNIETGETSAIGISSLLFDKTNRLIKKK